MLIQRKKKKQRKFRMSRPRFTVTLPGVSASVCVCTPPPPRSVTSSKKPSPTSLPWALQGGACQECLTQTPPQPLPLTHPMAPSWALVGALLRGLTSFFCGLLAFPTPPSPDLGSMHRFYQPRFPGPSLHFCVQTPSPRLHHFCSHWPAPGTPFRGQV